jgi:hypothetical protein
MAWADVGNERASMRMRQWTLAKHGRWYSGEEFRQDFDSY